MGTTRRPVPTTFTTRGPTPTRFNPVTTPRFSPVTTPGAPFKAVVDTGSQFVSPSVATLRPTNPEPIITTTFRPGVIQQSPAASPAAVPATLIPASETASGNGRPDKVKAGEDYYYYYYYYDDEEVPEGEETK